MSLTYTWLPADKPDPQCDSYLNITSANGSYLITNKGEHILDTISSWWCKPLGHSHAIVIKSIRQQLTLFDHHIPARAWNDNIENLSEKLISIFENMDKVMYASDGSSAVEIAMKLSYESRVLTGEAKRHKFIALKGGYHGETIFTLGVCGIDAYKLNYQRLLIKNYFIHDIPYVTGRQDPVWNDCQFNYQHWDQFFATYAPLSTALIIEPIVQGAAGMKIISKDFLIKIISLAKKYDLHIIADEIMVGLGRLGCYSASKDILGIEPDIVCFAKSLTAGSIPMSAVVINKSISEIFRMHKQTFDHSHTHSCNGLAAAVANSYLDYLSNSDLFMKVKLGENLLQQIIVKLKNEFDFIQQPRVIGAIAAFEINLCSESINQIFELAIQENLYLRTIGNTLYIMPPLYNLQEDIEIIEIRLRNLLSKL